MEEKKQQHFMVVTYPAQGHINPGRHLAVHLARATGARVTFSTSTSAHRRMFPSLSSPDQRVEFPVEGGGVVTYLPFSDGYDEGAKHSDAIDFINTFKTRGPKNLSKIIQSLAAEGHPVTCVIDAILQNWVADIARELGILSASYWIQPATVFSMYYHYFHGYQELISSHCSDPSYTVALPGLPPLQIKDLPSFFSISPEENNPYSIVITLMRDLYDTFDREAALKKMKPIVLVNTFDELEPEGLASVKDMRVIAVGPVLLPPTAATPGDLFQISDDKKYTDWLDSKPEKTVVYISFGSMSVLQREQTEEMAKALKESGKPYLWVITKESNKQELKEDNYKSSSVHELVEGVDAEQGMVVEWCSQVKVLSHKAVGCFVTHCGWNSTLESLVSGVATVCFPQWSDQGTNMKLIESVWGTGLRPRAADSEGMVIKAAEFRRCLDAVMDGEEIKNNTAVWKEKASAAVREGGSSDKNLKMFVEEITTTRSCT